jgi:tetratricopeptide (TPR) repeat protein
VTLLLVTVAAYYGVQQYNFISLDDKQAIVENPQLSHGITMESIRWAFTTNYCYGYWMPLTWLSFIFDRTISGQNAGYYHLVNLFFHAINVVLLFLVLRRLTGLLWLSVFVACLFAIHPINVESVAWVSARKDMVSTFFWLLTVLVYIGYAKKQTCLKYGILTLLFLLSLMAKPMAVTLPFVLLLIDIWPLNRISEIVKSDKKITRLRTDAAHGNLKALVVLVKEKALLFIISFVFVAVNMLIASKSKTAIGLSDFPLNERIANALISYTRYLEKLFFPSNMGVLYPLPNPPVFPFSTTAVATVVLLAVTVAGVMLKKRAPYVLFGWLWFLGILIPVIGLAQTGPQAIADRFVYIPAIGIFIIVSWGGADILKKIGLRKKIPLIIITALIAGALLFQTRKQHGYWRNSESLYNHTLAVTEKNYVIENSLGVVLLNSQREWEAIQHFRNSASWSRRGEYPLYNIGLCYANKGVLDSAKFYFQKAIDSKPDYYQSYQEMGNVFEREKNDSLAMLCYKVALFYKPDFLPSLKRLGFLFYSHDRFDDAIACFNKALVLDPNSYDISYLLRMTYQKKENLSATHR